MSSSNTQESPSLKPRQPLREDEFLTFDELMDRLPETTTREAIRALCRRGLRRHKIGRTTYFHVREIIAASAIGDSEDPEE